MHFLIKFFFVLINIRIGMHTSCKDQSALIGNKNLALALVCCMYYFSLGIQVGIDLRFSFSLMH